MEKDPANQLMVQISPLFTGFLYTSQVFSLFLPSTVSGQSVPKTCWNEYSFVFTTCTCFTVPLHPTSPERRPEKKSAITRLESAKHEKHVTCHNHSSICWEPCLIALTMTSIQCTLLMFHSNINYSANGVNTLNFQPWVDWLSWRCRIFRWVCRWWLGRKICEHAKVDTRGKNHWEWLQNLTAKKLWWTACFAEANPKGPKPADISKDWFSAIALSREDNSWAILPGWAYAWQKLAQILPRHNDWQHVSIELSNQ